MKTSSCGGWIVSRLLIWVSLVVSETHPNCQLKGQELSRVGAHPAAARDNGSNRNGVVPQPELN